MPPVSHVDRQSERYGVIATSGKGLRYEAFLNHPGLALHMARFPEAERRRLHKMICMSILPRSPTLGLEDQHLLAFGRG